MAFFKDRRFSRKNYPQQRVESPEPADPSTPESTGSEAAYLRSLVDSRALVTVVFKDGERVRGRIRYYDRDCISIGPAAGGPKIFLRKSSVHSILEE